MKRLGSPMKRPGTPIKRLGSPMQIWASPMRHPYGSPMIGGLQQWWFLLRLENDTHLYVLVGEPDRLIEITVDKLDVDCSNGLIMVIWYF